MMHQSLFHKKIARTIQNASVIEVNRKSKIVIFSDCHRGHGDRSDDFFHNQHIFINALKHYQKNGFVYIELGDGDELWENADFRRISERYRVIYELFDELHSGNRFRFIWGNHNRRWKNGRKFRKQFGRVINEKTGKEVKLLKKLHAEEAVILRFSKDRSKDILLIHGHQGELLNDRLWWFGRFFIRVFWRFFQMRFGFADPTSPAENYRIRRKVDLRFMEIAGIHKKAVIIGHTHFPVFPDKGEIPYINDGSCVHPRCITGVEIRNGEITLIKWSYTQSGEGYLKLTREVISGPIGIEDLFEYFSMEKKI